MCSCILAAGRRLPPSGRNPALGRMIHAQFNVSPNVEAGIEIDPRRLTHDHVMAMWDAGFNRASIGVQDNNPIVQQAVHRIQPRTETAQVVEWIRSAGFQSLNIDLIYGLPHQTVASFEQTPGQYGTQSGSSGDLQLRARAVDQAGPEDPQEGNAADWRNEAPDPEADHREADLAGLRLHRDGSFAKVGDELAVAQAQKTLQRNFQRYSTHGGSDIYAFGMSSISQAEAVYWQNEKELPQFTKRSTTESCRSAKAIY